MTGKSESLPELGHRPLCNEGYAILKVETSASESLRHDLSLSLSLISVQFNKLYWNDNNCAATANIVT